MRVLLVLILLAALSACGGGDDAAEQAKDAAMPAGLTAYLDQGRLQRESGEVRIRLVNETDASYTVVRAEISSERFEQTVWTGKEIFSNEVDLEFMLPRAGCGPRTSADVVLTYRRDGGPLLRSSTVAEDRYHQVSLLMDRDCAQGTLDEAATLTTGEARLVGTGRNTIFELPVRLQPTGDRDDVAFGGFTDTVLFANVEGSAASGLLRPRPLTSESGEVDVLLRVAPARCDPHALAEDKVGTLFGVVVRAPGLPANATFYLPISDDARALLRSSFGPHCGL